MPALAIGRGWSIGLRLTRVCAGALSRGYRTNPLGAVGVAATDLDLTAPLSNVDEDQLRRDVVEHELVMFKKQSGITSEKTLKVAELLGPLEVEPQQGKAAHPEQPHPAISRLSNSPEHGLTSIGNTRLHIDGQYLSKPNDFALYHTLKASRGSETWFVSMSKVLDSIPRKTLAFWDTLWQKRIMHMHGYRLAGVIHPFVVTHPRTNKNVLCTHLGFIENFLQYYGTSDESLISKQETDDIVMDIDQVLRGTGDCNIYKHQWDDDDVIITDNWSVLHVAGPHTQQKKEDVGLRIFHRILTTGTIVPRKDYCNVD